MCIYTYIKTYTCIQQDQLLNMTHCFLLFVIVFCYMQGTTTNIHACSQTERTSLLSFALTLSSPSFLNWTSDDCGLWQGINCNAAGWVTHQSLPSKGLALKQDTTFPSSTVLLGNLTHLTHLNLDLQQFPRSKCWFLLVLVSS
ncbi:hypothetical protein RchiOBHm_Chr3g0460481 [Rosa chinensis]|uniref:Non-specific serine/threonine protein kinase n=1 Tax=Rosa chinensis TaxID=74649 RepID=A0A2P6R8G9_ROSCH|nr:hypothetical protein RchiOBHm_Chr3g0460481 [Rosa chinensis]